MEATAGLDIIKSGEPKFHFNVTMLDPINVGVEGEKCFVSLNSRKGEHGRYFLKSIDNREELETQIGKYKILKARGIPIPPVCKPAQLPDGNLFLLVTDLTEGDKYQVLSANNPEIFRQEYKEFVRNFPESSKQTIAAGLIDASFAAAGINSTTGLQLDGPIYELGPQAWMLITNPQDPLDSKPIVADLGKDVTLRRSDEIQEVIKDNLLESAWFFARLCGGTLQLPDTNEYSGQNSELKKYAEKLIKMSGY